MDEYDEGYEDIQQFLEWHRGAVERGEAVILSIPQDPTEPLVDLLARIFDMYYYTQ